jgi:hypothetical protein
VRLPDAAVSALEPGLHVRLPSEDVHVVTCAALVWGTSISTVYSGFNDYRKPRVWVS